MKDSIHKKLTEHIRKTVGRHELPYEPGSWEEFQRQRRKREQRPVVWFRYALAACLLLGVLGVPVWFYVGRPDSTELAVHQPKTGFSGKKLTEKSAENRRSVGAILSERIASAPKIVDSDKKPLTSHLGSKTTLGAEKYSAVNELAVSAHQLKNRIKSPKTGSNQSSDLFPDIRQTDSYSNQPKELPGQTASFDRITPRSMRFSQRPPRPLGLPLSVWKEEPVIAKTVPSTSGQKPIWGVSLAPQSVYATGSSPSAAVGGGLFSEIPLNHRFSLSTGLSMAQQKLGTSASGQIVLSTNIPHLVSTHVRLTAVDLPLNIRFRPKNRFGMGFYAEAGLSSVAFLNEHYAYTYEQTKSETILVMGTNGQEHPVTQLITTQETTNRSEPAFQKIYWGRIINFSVGVERRIGTQFRLSAEPYLKYPIGPFTRENLMLGSGGVSLRLGFQSGR
jgi:hypothetical protein